MRTLRLKALTGILCVVTLPGAAFGDPAGELFRKGTRAQRQGRDIEAYLLYSQARALEPANPDYARAASRVRRSAAGLLAATGQYRAAMEMLPDSWEYARHPGEGRAESSLAEVRVTRSGPRPTQPARLRYSAHDAAFRFRGTLREAYEAVADEFGVRVLFHPDFDGDRAFRGELQECGFRCLMRILGQMGRTLAVPLDEETILVANDDASARGELEPFALTSIPLDRELDAEDVSQVAQVIQQVLDIERIQALVSGDALVLRSPVQKLDMARALATDLLQPSPSVHIEIQMLTVSQGRQVRAGIDLPGTFPVANFSTLFGAVPPAAGTERLIGFGGGETALGVAIGDASVEARLNTSSAQAVYTANLRTGHGKESTFKVGESFPIATAQFSGGALAVPGPGTPGYVQPPPSVSFQDLGLSMVITTLVHDSREVTLALDVALKFLAGAAVNGIPVLSNREFQSQVRLREGEFAIVSGTSVFERRLTAAGQGVLGSIPLIGNLFRRRGRRWDQRDMLILVRPRVASRPPSQIARSRAFLFGSEERPVPAL